MCSKKRTVNLGTGLQDCVFNIMILYTNSHYRLQRFSIKALLFKYRLVFHCNAWPVRAPAERV